MKYLIICLATILISCNGSSQEISEKATVSKKSSKKGSCLADITDPKEWYSLSAVSSLFSEPEENIDRKSRTGYINILSFRCHVKRETVNWSDISITIKNLDEAIEKDSKRYDRNYTYEEYFDAYHGPITKKDKKKIEEEVDKKGKEDESFDTKTAKKVLSYMAPQGYVELKDLGDKAHYYFGDIVIEKAVSLTVLHRNVVIEINVEMSADDEEDLRVAKKIAQDLMKMCD
jgi:hypothetical protein